jgi:DNA polymerase III alpha subunit
LLLYEENVIAVIERVLGCSADEADELRAAIVRGEDVSATFLARAAAGGFSAVRTLAIWSELGRFAAYSFSKAHAASAALIAYQSAYARVHQKTQFACAVLNHHGGLYPLRTVAADLSRAGVELRPPDVNLSEMSCTLADDAVQIGLEKLHHVSDVTKQALLDERVRGGPFRTLAELVARVVLAQRELQALVLSGACDALAPLTREAYPFAHEVLLGAAPRVPRATTRPEQLNLYRSLVRVNNELRYLSMHPTEHPMRLLRPEARRAGCVATPEAVTRAGRRIRTAGVVAATRRVRTAAGEIMQFVTLEDESGLLESVVSAKFYEELGDPIQNPGPYLVEGSVAVDAGVPTLHIDSVKPFHRRERPYAA